MKTYRKILVLVIALSHSWVANAQIKDNADALVKQGIALHDEQKYTEAIQKYQQALKLEPRNELGLYEMGYTLFMSGKGGEAVPSLEKVLEINPKSGGAYDLLGSIYDDKGEREKAIDYYLKGIKAAPEYQRLHFNIAITYYRIGKFAESEANALNAIKLDPTHASSQRIYAMATNEQNKLGSSLLGWCSFLLLEPQSKRSTEAVAYIKAIISSGIKKTAEKAVNITIRDKDLSSGNLLMPITVVNATSGKTNLSPVDSLSLQLTSLFSIAHTIAADKDKPVVGNYLANYFEQLSRSGNMPAFTRYISLSAYATENQAWFKEHEKEVNLFSEWVEATKRDF